MIDSPFAVECPRCGAQPTEPCWHRGQPSHPLKWPHAERLAEYERIVATETSEEEK